MGAPACPQTRKLADRIWEWAVTTLTLPLGAGQEPKSPYLVSQKHFCLLSDTRYHNLVPHLTRFLTLGIVDVSLNVFLVPGVRVEVPATETTCSFALSRCEDTGQETVLCSSQSQRGLSCVPGQTCFWGWSSQ